MKLKPSRNLMGITASMAILTSIVLVVRQDLPADEDGAGRIVYAIFYIIGGTATGVAFTYLTLWINHGFKTLFKKGYAWHTAALLAFCFGSAIALDIAHPTAGVWYWFFALPWVWFAGVCMLVMHFLIRGAARAVLGLLRMSANTGDRVEDYEVGP